MTKQRCFSPVLGSNCCYASCQLTFVTLPSLRQPTGSIEKSWKTDKRKPLWFTRLRHSYTFHKRQSGHSGLTGGQDRDRRGEPMKINTQEMHPHRSALSSTGVSCHSLAVLTRTSWRGLGWTTFPTGPSGQQGNSMAWMGRSSGAGAPPGGSCLSNEHLDSNLEKKKN